MPVYNEKNTILKILKKVKEAKLPKGIEKEIIIVDDGSQDGTREILNRINDPQIRIFFHSKNQGKGAAIRTGLNYVKGDIILIQDADLEYDPNEYPRLLKPILEGKTSVVYGSRFLGERKAMFFWHHLGNKLLSFITNLLYDSILTDMETCYKVFKKEVLEGIKLKANRFDFEPEFTAKILKKKYRIYEVPISYCGREYHEGKKITWRDGITALYTLIKYRFFD